MGNSATRDAKALEVAEWRAEALRLRVEELLSIRAIARRLGKSPSTVHEAIDAEIAAIPAEQADRLRVIESERLDRDEAKLDALVLAHEEQARTAVDLGMGEVRGNGAKEAADIVVKAIAGKTAIRARRAKMLGLDAAEVVDVTTHEGEVTPAAAQEAMRRAFGSVARKDDADGSSAADAAGSGDGAAPEVAPGA